MAYGVGKGGGAERDSCRRLGSTSNYLVCDRSHWGNTDREIREKRRMYEGMERLARRRRGIVRIETMVEGIHVEGEGSYVGPASLGDFLV